VLFRACAGLNRRTRTMIIANTANAATYDAASHPTTFPAMAVRPAAALPTLLSSRACSLTDTGRSASPHFAYVPGLKVREEGEQYLPDLPRRADDEEYEADPELSDAVRTRTGNVRQARPGGLRCISIDIRYRSYVHPVQAFSPFRKRAARTRTTLRYVHSDIYWISM
jgi:hypothetical protein